MKDFAAKNGKFSVFFYKSPIKKILTNLQIFFARFLKH